MALQAEKLLLLVQPYTSYFIHIRLIVQSLINNTHNISMEVPCPRMLSNKQHPLVLGHKVTNTNTRQYSSMQGSLAEGLARGCLFGHYIESCLFLTLPYMSLTSKAQQKKSENEPMKFTSTPITTMATTWLQVGVRKKSRGVERNTYAGNTRATTETKMRYRCD